ncbi:hypothetical protein Pmani_013292 [Petrolisthes manimaculis]|uniref:Cadherin domain-containing protein n=1 Tax=Petrolisthes manimaculis TaxID=1843537 RepID=A0AAE1PVS5_9EUCA|nr:hypothetical protein Pmani_013292 [Petrolisthes manimaculis]
MKDSSHSSQHELVVWGAAGRDSGNALVRVVVGDVNDNPPSFVRPNPTLTVIEEDDRDVPIPLAEVRRLVF